MEVQKKKLARPAGLYARREFIKKAALGVAFALPALESVTRSDLLVKSALAATVPTWTITASRFPLSTGDGTVSPMSQTVADGGSVTITVTPIGGGTVPSYWLVYRIDGGGWVPVALAQQTGGTYTFAHVTANHTFEAGFGIEMGQ
jgi:hypothetical protein